MYLDKLIIDLNVVIIDDWRGVTAAMTHSIMIIIVVCCSCDNSIFKSLKRAI